MAVSKKQSNLELVKANQQKWEYKREPANNVDHLNNLGELGWEVITESNNYCLMKRPKE